MKEQIRSIKQKEVWTLTALPPSQKHRYKVGIRKKTNDAGRIERYNERLVEKSFSQKPGVKFREIYVPVIKY